MKFSGSRMTVLVIVMMAVAALAIFVVARKPSGWHTEPTQPKAPIKIGAILPLSGNLAFMGKMEGDGMRLAVEDINAKGGINGAPLELKFDDSQGKPDVGITAAQHMMTLDGIKTIVASFTSVVLGIKPVVERNGGILIGACMHPDFFKGATNVFRFYIGVEDESKGFVDYLTSLTGTTREPRIGLLYVEAPNVVEQVEKYVEPGLAKAGMSFAVKESYRLTDKEFRDKILKLRAANITHLLIIEYGFLYPNIFQELKDQKLFGNIQIVGGWGFLYPNLPPADLEGVIVVGPDYVFQANPAVDDFYVQFSRRFKSQANFDAAMTHAGIEILAAALRRTATRDPRDIAVALHEVSEVQTVLGWSRLSQDGSLSFSISTGVFRNGRLQKLASP